LFAIQPVSISASTTAFSLEITAPNGNAQPIAAVLLNNNSGVDCKVTNPPDTFWLNGWDKYLIHISTGIIPPIGVDPNPASTGTPGTLTGTVYQVGDTIPAVVQSSTQATSINLQTGGGALEVAGNVSVAGTVDANIQGTPSFNLAAGAEVALAAGSTVTIASAEAAIDVIASGTVNVGGGSVNVAGSSPGTLQDFSGTLATPNVSTLIVGASTTRSYLLIQNISNGTLWVGLAAPATIGGASLQLLPGMGYTSDSVYVISESIYLMGTFPGQAYVCKVAQ
jgi:hypothetical protein